MIRTLAFWERALAISTICWSATERPRTGVVAVNETPSGRSRASTSRFISRQSIRPKRDFGCRPM
jgi:hypothetical protein